MTTLQQAEQAGRAVAERFRNTCPNLTAYLPQPADEEFPKMIDAIQAFATAAAPEDVLTYTLFSRAMVNSIKTRLFAFREWAPDSLAAKEFGQLELDANQPLPFDPEPEATPEHVASGIEAIFTNF